MAKCVKCQSDQVVPDLRIFDAQGHYIRLSVSVDEHPDAMVFKGAHPAPLHARLCGSCGAVELYVDNAAELYAVYVATQRQG